eukprot:gb/GECG01015702.1/.p1 GENE.gb/GECG01015702.1/~~gb/GECG01015702.1/.p1  ORF type:complete len:631 (+),score=52.04 gb/GECG01015702.1/:1-1893(+)
MSQKFQNSFKICCKRARSISCYMSACAGGLIDGSCCEMKAPSLSRLAPSIHRLLDCRGVCTMASVLGGQSWDRASSEEVHKVHRALMGSMSRPPVVFIVGTTGTGKSKLAIDLAQRFNGEIINADVIQMYKGLKIASAKVTKEETQGVPHHLFSFLEPHEEFSVRLFQTVAREVIHEVHGRDALPIVVGGTMYYTQSLLRPSTLADDEEKTVFREQEDESPESIWTKSQGDLLLGGDPPDKIDTIREAHEQLRQIDPKMAEKLHPNDWRKISRSLEIYKRTGKPHSEHILAQQRAAKEKSHEFNHCILWIYCSRDELDKRLGRRVDKMVDRGLLEEVSQLHQALNGKTNVPFSGDCVGPSNTTIRSIASVKGKGYAISSQPRSVSSGLLQAIGYKEFRDYLESDRGTDANALMGKCIESLKTVTRQYSRQQLNWIRNRFLRRGVEVFELDATNISRWEVDVLQPASDLVSRALRGERVTSVALASNDDQTLKQWTKYTCHYCNVVCNGEKEWSDHIRSRKHRKRATHRTTVARDFLAYVNSLQLKHGYTLKQAESTAQHQQVFKGWSLQQAEDEVGVCSSSSSDTKRKKSRRLSSILPRLVTFEISLPSRHTIILRATGATYSTDFVVRP